MSSSKRGTGKAGLFQKLLSSTKQNPLVSNSNSGSPPSSPTGGVIKTNIPLPKEALGQGRTKTKSEFLAGPVPSDDDLDDDPMPLSPHHSTRPVSMMEISLEMPAPKVEKVQDEVPRLVKHLFILGLGEKPQIYESTLKGILSLSFSVFVVVKS